MATATQPRALLTGSSSVEHGYLPLFFVSGFPALLYQIVWERALFSIYGVNVESVTVIVTAFMLGLGLGSLAGGVFASRVRQRPLLAFGLIEMLIGVFGCFSLMLFHGVGSVTAGASTLKTSLLAFSLLLLPTFLMGSTLPLLVEHLASRIRSVGQAVGLLYCVNALGSAFACWCAAMFLMRILGEHGVVWLAASLNLLVASSALYLHRAQKTIPSTSQELPTPENITSAASGMPMWYGTLLAGAVGFIALACEIVWYRLFSFVTGGTAPCFAKLLAFYLLGLAYGSFAVRDFVRKAPRSQRDALSAGTTVVVFGSAIAFLVGPLLARFASHVAAYEVMFAFVFAAAALLGAAFPLLSHAFVQAEQHSGRGVSYLYLSNILGSAAGSLIVGFFITQALSLRGIAMALLIAGTLVALLFAVAAKGIGRAALSGLAGCLLLAAFSHPLYSHLYERLLYKTAYDHTSSFENVVENRSGVIAVDPHGVVYGGGVYDGRFNTDLMNDTNGISRLFAAMALRPSAANVLVIGLSSGSWAQIIASAPNVRHVTVVEINPGYLPLIRERRNVSSLLKNPKVQIIIDDGRRWLKGHPEPKFDLIVMNTTFNWRANASNLLSTEFLDLARAHLAPGGMAFYNTTMSDRALATGASSFRHSLRVLNFIAVSDSPLLLERDSWRSYLLQYSVDGQPVVDVASKDDLRKLELLLSNLDRIDQQGSMFETGEHLRKGLASTRVITDDNMGTEWD